MIGFGKMFRAEDERLSGVPSAEEFSALVIRIADRYTLSHFDAMLEICMHHDRDPESVRSLITPHLKLILADEAATRNLLKDRDYLARKLG